jgi:hypothetical protein
MQAPLDRVSATLGRLLRLTYRGNAMCRSRAAESGMERSNELLKKLPIFMHLLIPGRGTLLNN